MNKPRPRLPNLPHPAFISSGPQLDGVIAELEAGTMRQPDEGAVWRPDCPREQRHRLARATGASALLVVATTTTSTSARATVPCQSALA